MEKTMKVNFRTKQPVPVTYFFVAYNPDRVLGRSGFYPIDRDRPPKYCADVGAECCSCTREGHKCCGCTEG